MTIRVWFERFGTVDANGYIRYQDGVRGVDPNVVSRQGQMDAGPLYGQATLANLDEATVAAVQEDRKDDPLYMELGKRFVKLAVPKLQRLVMLLRTLFGQYWLEDVPDWDSTTQSLGSYCLRWGMMWSFDRRDWRNFQPNKPSVKIHGTWSVREDYSGYLTKEDWGNLGQLVQSNYQPSDAVEICNRARLLRDSGNLRHAIIEGVSALEIAVKTFGKSAVHRYAQQKCDGPFVNIVQKSFDNLPAHGRMEVVGYLVQGISATDKELAAEAIMCRNELVHAGAEVPKNAAQLFDATVRFVLAILDGPAHKYPPNDGTNKLFPPDGMPA